MSYNLGRVGFNLRGNYDAAATYDRLDIVTKDGSTFAAIQPSTNIPVTNTEYWQYICGSDEGWGGTSTPLTLNSSVAETTAYCNGNLRARKIGSHIYISGGFHQKQTTGTIATLPAGYYNPNWSANREFWCWGNSGVTNYAVKLSISKAGVISVLSTRRINDNTDSTVKVHVDTNFDYWLD